MGSLGEGDSKTVSVSMGQHRIHASAEEGQYVDEKKIDVDEASQTELRIRLKATDESARAVAVPGPKAFLAASESCVEIPEFSAKVPALPAGSPCAKHLYKVSDGNLEYISPLEGLTLSTIVGWKRAPESYSLDYVDIRVGTGPIAILHDFIAVHYTGYLADGTKFDSSLDRGEPIVFPYGDGHVIRGWDTGFAGMRVGGKRRLFIPSELAYGVSRKGPIPPNAELIFDVELMGQSDQAQQSYSPSGPRDE